MVELESILLDPELGDDVFLRGELWTVGGPLLRLGEDDVVDFGLTNCGLGLVGPIP